MRIQFARAERHDLLKSWLLVSLAFGIFLGRDALWPFDGTVLLVSALVALCTVGIGVVLHEIAHKLAAHHFGYVAEYRADDTLLVVGLLTSVLGFFFAAPGFVQYRGAPDPDKRGMIAAAGPVTNVGLALVFLAFSALASASLPTLASVLLFGAVVNSWVAVFNLLPFGLFDGAKVLAWSGVAYGALAAASVLLAVATQLLQLTA